MSLRHTTPSLLASRLLTLALVAAAASLGCAHVEPSTDQIDPSAQGQGGSGGDGGSSGAGGASGQGGASGKAGSSGSSGSAAQAGSAGQGGQAGQGGSAGSSGKGGEAAMGGSGGNQGGSSGSGGSSGGGTGQCGPDQLVINEVAPSGPNGANDEFVELFNPGSCSVKLDGFTVKYSSKSGSSPQARWTGSSGDTIASGGFFLLGTTDFSGKTEGTLMAGLSADGGAVGLFDKSDGQIDGVAWQSADKSNPLGEGSPAPAFVDGNSIARKSDGLDTNNNSADFTSDATPSPGKPN